MNASWKHNAKWKMPVTDNHILYNSFMRWPEEANPETESRVVVAKGWEQKARMGNVYRQGFLFDVLKML